MGCRGSHGGTEHTEVGVTAKAPRRDRIVAGVNGRAYKIAEQEYVVFSE